MNDEKRPLVPRRTLIFVPGNRPDRYVKALASGADVTCVDLEDGIAPSEKVNARDSAFSQFAAIAGYDDAERVIRINCLRTTEGMRDIQTLVAMPHAPAAIMLPKVRGPEEVRNLSDLLDDYQISTRFHVIVETNEGLETAHAIAQASNRNESLLFGGVDMAADLGCLPTWSALLYARSRVVHAAATAGLDAIDVPYLDLNDEDGLLREALAARELGYTGKGAIHPKQIATLNEVFTPGDDAVTEAKRIMAAFSESAGGLLVVDGKLYEKPVLRNLARILIVHERLQSRANS